METVQSRAAEKAAWRERFRAVRARLSVAARTEASHAIVQRVDALVQQAPVVSLFWPLVDRGEVDVRPLVARLVARDAIAALPAVLSQRPARLEHRAVAWEADLVAGVWGLTEPAPGCPVVPPGQIAAAVVPALGLGRDGSRLGYGGGYYDHFLAETTALRIGVVWHGALVDALPAEPHDEPLDVLVTEHETVWTGRAESTGA